MKAFTVLTIALLTLSFVGCVSSVNPLYTESDVIFNTDLLGDWSDGEMKLTFTRQGENAYILITSEEGGQASYRTHLVQLDNHTYLDIYPLDTLENSYLFEATHFPTHFVWKIEIRQEEILLSEMDGELGDSLIQDSRFDIPYVQSEDGWILVTASTEKLQKFFRENENLFIEPVIYRKEK